MTAKRAKRVTLAEVAQAAGVSKTTASLILNEKSAEARLAPSTCARVWRAARRLDYRPNRTARGLATGRTHLVGILTVHAELLFETHYGPQLMRGFTHVTGARGYNIVVLDGEAMKREGGRARSFRHLVDRQIEGLFVLTGDEPDPIIDVALELAQQEGCPVLEAWHSLPHNNTASICVDNDKAVELVVSRLWGLGHRNIALVVESRASYGGGALERCFRAAMQRRAMAETATPVLELGYEEPASRLITRLMNEDNGQSLPTAFFVAYDDNAMKIARELKRHGLTIPDDVSIIGYANDPVVSNFEPALASVDFSLEEKGGKVATILLDWIEDGVAPGHQLWAEITLVERSSVAPAREEVMWLSNAEGVAETLEQGSVV